MNKLFKFHSIEQYRSAIHTVKAITNADGNHNTLPVLKFQGSCKTHGTCSAIVLPDNYPQSKNQVLEIGNDNYGFALWHSTNKDVFDRLYLELKTLLGLKDNVKIVVYGEWAGKGIQDGVGISEIEKSLFIFDIKVIDNEEYFLSEWIILESYNQYRIYDIKQFGVWDIEIDFNSPSEAQNKMVEWTNQVEKECPVAKWFGISGIGEGIVYKNYTWDKNNPLVWKVKGDKHSATKTKTLASIDTEKVKGIVEFLEYALTENRMEQAFNEIFTARGIRPTKERTSEFLKWLQTDIIKEESDTLKDASLDVKMLTGKLSEIARRWLIDTIRNC